MKHYTIFDSTGIKCVLFTNTETLELNLKAGDSWVEGNYPSDLYYVDGGSLQPYPPEPNYPCQFNQAAKVWVWDEQASGAILRQDRRQRLAASDWTQAADAPVDKEAWAAYRQQLRDLPSNTADPRTPVWPVAPTL